MKTLNVLALALLVLMLGAAPALAQGTGSNYTLAGAGIGAGLGAALTMIGAGWGFGRIGAAALEGMARQPEAAANIQTGMIIIGALLEGATFFALLICFLLRGAATF
jgi:F-type H+-transporting ATPase subunit c